MTTHMEDLPDELLLRILDLLPYEDLIDVVPCVCLRWLRLTLDSHIWKNRTYDVYGQPDSDVVKFFSRKPALRSVLFENSVREPVLQSLAIYCPTITSLTLDYEQRLTLNTLRLIARNCDQINDLFVSSAILSCRDSAREVALMPHLETLAVEGDQHLQLRELGFGCARLRHLDLKSADNFRLGDLGAPLLRRLQGLSICWKFVSRDIVQCAESLKKLELWDYDNSPPPDSSLVEDLLPLQALIHVEATDLSSSSQLVISLMQPLLQTLKLTDCFSLTDNLLQELCRRCPLLEDLDLSGCDGITAQGLSYMWSLQRLRRLCLNQCERLRNGAMTHLARLQDRLQELSLHGVNMYRMEPGVSQLLELRKLRVLVFNAWSARHLIPWEMLPKAFPHLRTLKLGEWGSYNTSVPDSLKVAMPTVDVTWYINDSDSDYGHFYEWSSEESWGNSDLDEEW